jgi:hypothetical protein
LKGERQLRFKPVRQQVKYGRVKQLDATTLVNLLHLYESAIRELESLRDPGVAGLLRRMERHRSEVIMALAERAGD